MILLICAFSSLSAKQTEHFSKHYNYLMYSPDAPVPADGYPLLLFLHGSGERGNDFELIKKWGPPSFLDDTTDFPLMVVSPQCPYDQLWDPLVLQKLVLELLDLYSIDEDRIIITGLSIGGTATWELALAYPHLPAAIVPICGQILPEEVCKIKNIPAWVYHGALDQVYSHKYSDDMVDALRSCGGKVKYTLYPEEDHLSWIPAYADPALYDWMLKQKKTYE